MAEPMTPQQRDEIRGRNPRQVLTSYLESDMGFDPREAERDVDGILDLIVPLIEEPLRADLARARQETADALIETEQEDDALVQAYAEVHRLNDDLARAQQRIGAALATFNTFGPNGDFEEHVQAIWRALTGDGPDEAAP